MPQGTSRAMKPSIVYLRPTYLVSYRAVGPYEESASAAWTLMFDWLDAHKLRGKVGRGFGFAHDDPRVTPPERCRYDACIDVPDGVSPATFEHMMPQRLPGGAYYRHRHVGSHSGISAAIRSIREMGIMRSGLMLAKGRPLLEIYLDDPKFCAREKLRTDLCLPVAFADELEVA